MRILRPCLLAAALFAFAAPAHAASPTFTNYVGPANLVGDAGEPSIGYNPKTDVTLFQADTTTRISTVYTLFFLHTSGTKWTCWARQLGNCPIACCEDHRTPGGTGYGRCWCSTARLFNIRRSPTRHWWHMAKRGCVAWAQSASSNASLSEMPSPIT